MDNGLPERVRFCDSVRLRFTPDKGFLFEANSGQAFSLNASATLAASRIYAGSDMQSVVTAVAEHFEVERSLVERDLQRFIAEMEREGLLATDDP